MCLVVMSVLQPFITLMNMRARLLPCSSFVGGHAHDRHLLHRYGRLLSQHHIPSEKEKQGVPIPAPHYNRPLHKFAHDQSKNEGNRSTKVLMSWTFQMVQEQ